MSEDRGTCTLVLGAWLKGRVFGNRSTCTLVLGAWLKGR